MFCELDTQWLSGLNGATGLRYEIVFALLDRYGYAGDDWKRIYQEIRVMEREALNVMAENRQ